MLRDTKTEMTLLQSIAPAVHASTQTPTNGNDVQGQGAVTCVVNVGAIVASGNVTVKLQESDVINSGFTDVAAADLVGSFPAALITNTVIAVGYVGNKRYVRAVGTLNSGTSVAYGASFVCSKSNFEGKS